MVRPWGQSRARGTLPVVAHGSFFCCSGVASEPRLLSPCFAAMLLLIAFYTYFNADQIVYNRKLLRKAGERLRLATEKERPSYSC